MKQQYRRRIVDDYFASRLKATGALYIEGAKWCGKTRTAEFLSKSAIYMQDQDNLEKNLFMAANTPSALLKGDTPRLIDEWQVEPKLWDAVRFEIDKRQERGQFILTGSSVPDIKEETAKRMHSGTGRIATVRMRPMSLFEFGDSSGDVTLSELFEGRTPDFHESDMTLEKLAYILCRGGWPTNLGLGKKESLRVSYDYLESIIRSDASRVDGVRRNPDDVHALLKSLARNISTAAKHSTIAEDMKGRLDRKTISGHINALKKIFVVEDTPAWAPALMSKSRVRKSPKRNFVDPSIAAAALGAEPQRLVKDLSSFGLLFESMCVRDLRSYSQPMDGTVFHYQDDVGLEVDAIVELRDGRWGAVEIKLNPQEENRGADNLLKLKKKIDSSKTHEPSFLMVVTGTGFVHRRDDGVIVVPIGCLRD